MTQAELKQQLNSMQDVERIEDVFFYSNKTKHTIVVVYISTNIIEGHDDKYFCANFNKIQDALNYFDT